MIPTPEHDKLKALHGENQLIGNFIEWLAENGYTICESMEETHWGRSPYYASFKSRDVILAQYFEIDRDKLEAEKVALLEEHRRLVSEG